MTPLPPAAVGPAPARSFCTFHLGEGLFGLDATLVQSVNLPPPLTPLPQAPDAVRGYANLRGQIHLVLDLKRLLNLGATDCTADTRLVVFKAVLGDPFGVLTDRVAGVAALRPDQIEGSRLSEADSASDGLVCGVGKFEGELISLLDAGKILPAVEKSLTAVRRATVSPVTETAS
ncbi:MAG TPA: chemotaxis protein CheW [Gemmataceae bacterium]|nr:chemotaxis protein CheW [Gemmataceae bacterium]